MSSTNPKAQAPIQNYTNTNSSNEKHFQQKGAQHGGCNVCLGSVITGESCVRSEVDLLDGPQDAGRVAAGQMRLRKQVDCMYPICLEELGDRIGKVGSERAGGA